MLGRLCRAACETAREMIAAASPAEGDITPGMIAVVQTFGDDFSRHPHVHALLTRGGWERDGQWTPVPFVDGEATALVLRHKVFRLLQREGLLSEGRTHLLLSWRHSGFMDRNCLSVEDGVKAGVEAPRGLRRQPVGVRGAMLGCTRAMGTGVYHLQSVEKLSLAGLGTELLDALLRMGC